MAEIEIKPWECSHCGQMVNMASSFDDKAEGPKENDLTLCFYCTELHVMHNGKFVAMTDDELIGIPLDQKRVLSALQLKLRQFWKEEKKS
jgi:hypothetical protein